MKNTYDLNTISKIYGNNFSSYDAIPTPTRNSSAFTIFFQFYDTQMIEKFLKSAQKQYPGLSMEVRVDNDPIYLSKWYYSWYSHSSTYNTGTNYTTIYYSISMGALNNFDYQKADVTLYRMNNTFHDLKKFTGKNKIFVDQFIWFDKPPGFERNTQLYDNETKSFLHGSCEYLKNYTDGYGIWTYHDYIFNIVYNPTFAIGQLGWLTNGTTHLEQNAISLEKDSTITQEIPRTSLHGDSRVLRLNMTFYAKSNTQTADIKVDIGGKGFIKHITNSGSVYEFQIPINELKNFNITFRVLNGSITISDVKLYNFVERGGIYDTSWKPQKFINPVQQLNQCLSN